MSATSPFLAKFAKDAPEPKTQGIADKATSTTRPRPPSPTLNTRVGGETTDDR